MAVSKDASGKVDKKFALRQVQNACMCECRRGGWWCQSGRTFGMVVLALCVCRC